MIERKFESRMTWSASLAGTAALLVLLVGCAGGASGPAASDGAAPTTRRVVRPLLREGYNVGDGAKVGRKFNLAMRHPDFPNTFIRAIHLDLTSPDHWVRLEWAGPYASGQPIGPFHAAPGRGNGSNDCDDPITSNAIGSWCTPKGSFVVGGFADRLTTVTTCHYATFFDVERGIAIHSHHEVPDYPVSNGCVRMEMEPAKLIHNNSRAGMTTVTVGGEWDPPATVARIGTRE